MSPAASSDRDAGLAKSAVLDDRALAELREFTAAFERRLAGMPPIESVPPAAARAAAYGGQGTMPAPVFLPRAREVILPGRSGELRLRVLAPERDAAGVFLHLHGGGWVLGGCDLQDEPLWELVQATGLCAVSLDYRLAPEHRYPSAPDGCAAGRPLARGLRR
jgi:acetyl esterase